MTSPTGAAGTFEHVVCLGCGCACDDVTVRVDGGRIVDAAPTCSTGRKWFGDGVVAGAVLVDGKAASADDALAAAADLLARAAGRVLVHLAPELTSEAQRAALGLADLLHATVDTATSPGVAAGLLAAQRRGRAAATLGELRNRADLVVLWGVDPSESYGRFLERYVTKAGRSIVSVSSGADAGQGGTEAPITVGAADEVAALTVMRAAVAGTAPADLPPALVGVAQLAQRMVAARYVVIVNDAEAGRESARDARRAEALIALAQALNGPTRAALITLRAGGNRAGAEAVLSAQTGYPFAVDFSTGRPRYTPEARGLDRVRDGGFTAAVVVGAAAQLGDAATRALGGLPTVVIGPRASEASFGVRIAIDTGTAGIHEEGTAYRLDDVPLPLTAVLPGPRSAHQTITTLTRLVAQQLRAGTA